MLNRNFAIALAVAMVLAVLYGCSSSGGIKNDRDMYKEDAEMLQGSLDAANGEVTRLTGELATATMMAGDNAAEVTQLEGELATATMMAGDNAAEVTRLEGELATATMMAGDNAAEVTRLEGELATATMMAGDNAAEVTRLEGELATATMMAGDNAAEVTRLEGELATATMMAGDNAAEVTRLEGELTDATMARDDNAAEVARLQGIVDELQANQTANKPSHHNAAVVAGINGVTAMPDVANAEIVVGAYGDREVSFNTFTAGDETAPDAGAPWAGSMLGAMSDADATLILRPWLLWTRCSSIRTERRQTTPHTKPIMLMTDPAAGPGKLVVADTDPHADDDRRVLTFISAISEVSGGPELFMADTFPSSPHQNFEFIDDDGTMDVNENEVPGSFQGVPGTYICTDGACTVETDGDGALETLDGTWTFTPDEVAEDGDPHMVEAVTPDNTYVYFGYWLHVTDPGDDDKEAIGVGTFAGGSGRVDADASGMGAIDGSASYSGKAGGKYAIKTLTSRGEINSLRTGQFVAEVELTATFGGMRIPEADWDKISGTVSGFVDAADSDSTRLKHWTVSLGTASTDEDSDTNADSDGLNDNVGKTNDGMMNGTWTHVFHNQLEDDVDTEEVDESIPSHVTGTFDAHFSDGHTIGAYGATRD